LSHQISVVDFKSSSVNCTWWPLLLDNRADVPADPPTVQRESLHLNLSFHPLSTFLISISIPFFFVKTDCLQTPSQSCHCICTKICLHFCHLGCCHQSQNHYELTSGDDCVHLWNSHSKVVCYKDVLPPNILASMGGDVPLVYCKTVPKPKVFKLIRLPC